MNMNKEQHNDSGKAGIKMQSHTFWCNSRIIVLVIVKIELVIVKIELTFALCNYVTVTGMNNRCTQVTN